MPYSLEDLDQMDVKEANALSFEERNALLATLISSGRKLASGEIADGTALFCAYFEEDILRLAKLHAIRVRCRGVAGAVPGGVPPGATFEEKYRTAFAKLGEVLAAAETDFSKAVSMVVFLTDMSEWPTLNRVYKEFVTNPLCRAVIGTPHLANEEMAIEIVECIAYRVGR